MQRRVLALRVGIHNGSRITARRCNRWADCLFGPAPQKSPPRKESGYEDFLQAINNLDHPEHGQYLEWIGGHFDPEALDVDEVNRKLRGIR